MSLTTHTESHLINNVVVTKAVAQHYRVDFLAPREKLQWANLTEPQQWVTISLADVAPTKERQTDGETSRWPLANPSEAGKWAL